MKTIVKFYYKIKRQAVLKINQSLKCSHSYICIEMTIMKKYLVLFILFFFISCQKSNTSVTANYILFDSSNFPIADTITLQISSGNNVVYNGINWTYNSGYYFNVLDYIFLYAPNNDSIYITYPDTAYSLLTKHFTGYKE